MRPSFIVIILYYYSCFENTIEIINDNIKNIEKYLDKNSINAIVTNPPYKKENCGVKNENIIELHNNLSKKHQIKARI